MAYPTIGVGCPAQINICPNPVKDILVIRNHGNIPVAAQVQILDMLGRMLKCMAMSESSPQLNIRPRNLFCSLC